MRVERFILFQNNLRKWEGLRHIPKCWEVVQAYLCSVYKPRCVPVNNRTTMSSNVRSQVDQPRRDLCLLTRTPCRLVAESIGWPEFLKCDHEHYVSHCSVSIIVTSSGLLVISFLHFNPFATGNTLVCDRGFEHAITRIS